MSKQQVTVSLCSLHVSLETAKYDRLLLSRLYVCHIAAFACCVIHTALVTC
jgi:hypothetical protein